MAVATGGDMSASRISKTKKATKTFIPVTNIAEKMQKCSTVLNSTIEMRID
jgi:hypothetical protein